MNETASTPPARDLLPRHIGIIMDGNGRWAAKRGLPRKMGHQEGAKTFGKIVRYARDLGIGAVTVYAFSTENWKRPRDEVDALMDLLRRYLGELRQHKDDNARLLILGDRNPLPEDLRQTILQAEQESRENTGITVNVALNYGGRDEIVRGARQLAEACLKGELRPEEIDEERFSAALYTAGQPDPDFIIRPSGEMRLSNFMLWQAAYVELIFMHVLWPDFTPEHLNWALWEYAGRNRRFGGV